MRSKAVITGVGIVSALGDNPKDLHLALCRGDRAGIPMTSVNDRDIQTPCYAAPVQDFSPMHYLGDKNFRPLDRAGQLTVCAAHLALKSGDWTSELREATELDLVVGTTFCGAHTITQFDRETQISGPKFAKPLSFANTVINAAAGHTAIWHNLRGANTTVVAGKVSGLRALKHAQMQIGLGTSNVALVGGVEEFCFESYQGFLGAGRLQTSDIEGAGVPFSQQRDGFFLGEGAAFVVMEESEFAKNRGAKILGELLGHGSSYDVSRGQDESNAVERCASAIRSALSAAGISASDIDCVSCSANGSKVEDRYEALALANVFGERLSSIPLTAIGSTLGETLGASGILQSIAFIEAARDGRLPGIHGIGGHLDEALPKLRIGGEPIEGNFNTGLIVSLGYDGSSAATIISVPHSSSS
jgi:3-oxoacyl-[acyl-carrier-protein] synthase II